MYGVVEVWGSRVTRIWGFRERRSALAFGHTGRACDEFGRSPAKMMTSGMTSITSKEHLELLNSSVSGWKR